MAIERIETTILRNLLHNEEYYRKVVPFLKAEYYENWNIWCYFCVDPKTYKNYMFSPMDGENRDNQYSRLRNGVLNFSSDGFDFFSATMFIVNIFRF